MEHIVLADVIRDQWMAYYKDMIELCADCPDKSASTRRITLWKALVARAHLDGELVMCKHCRNEERYSEIKRRHHDILPRPRSDQC